MKEENTITEAIIGSAYDVANALGAGFLEKVYENALKYEVVKRGFQVEQQKAITVLYDGVVVGEYFADLLVEGRILVELKAVRSLDDIHAAQILNYLKAPGLRTGLLLNFGTPRVEVKRFRNG